MHLIYLFSRAQVFQPLAEGEAELGRVERGEHRLGAGAWRHGKRVGEFGPCLYYPLAVPHMGLGLES